MSNNVRRLRKKPVEIKGIQFNGTWGSALEIMNWADNIYFVPPAYDHHLRKPGEMNSEHAKDTAPPFLVIGTLEGDMRCDVNSWVLEGVQGEFYPCDNEILGKTYDILPKEKC